MFGYSAVEVILVVGLALAAAVPWWSGIFFPRRSGPGAIAALACSVLLVTILAAAWVQRDTIPPYEQRPTNRPLQVRSDDYVGSHACRSCHRAQHASWHASYHRSMTQVAQPTGVTGSFDEEYVKVGDVGHLLHRQDGKLMVTMGDPSWRHETLPAPRRSYEIVMTTGSHHMQLYWYDSGYGRLLGLLPLAYLHEQERWIPRNSAFVVPPGDPHNFPFGIWNTNCLRCHSTHPKPRNGTPAQSETVQTQVVEFGISCEACHGPGGAHVRANRDPVRRYQLHLRGGADPTIVNPARLSPVLSTEVCGQCHAVSTTRHLDDVPRWIQDGGTFRPGQKLSQSKNLVRWSEQDTPISREALRHDPNFFTDMFWPDGTVRVTGREYTALRETACFQDGELSCLSCHQMHLNTSDPSELASWANDQLDESLSGNRACLECHPQFGETSALVAHTHHAADSLGSNCYNCHMPFTSYGLLKAIRSHRIEVPNAATTRATGRPDGCSQCHLDRSSTWVASQLNGWYGQPIPTESAGEPHPIDDRDDDSELASGVDWALRGDAAQRVLIAWSFGWHAQRSDDDWPVPVLAYLLDDPYDAVRIVAERSLRSFPAYANLDYDFLAAPARRQAARDAVLQAWADQPARQARPELLIGPGGVFDRRLADRLWSERNDRPVSLAE